MTNDIIIWILIFLMGGLIVLLLIANDARRHREIEEYEERWDRTDDWRG